MARQIELTTDMLLPFIGGQLEITGYDFEELFRGEIESAVVEDNQIKVRFAWLAKNDGNPDRPSNEWTANSRLDYKPSLEEYWAAEKGDGLITINCVGISEQATFFPKGYTNNLDHAQVKGL